MTQEHAEGGIAEQATCTLKLMNSRVPGMVLALGMSAMCGYMQFLQALWQSNSVSMRALARGLLQIGFACICSATLAGAPVTLTASSCNPLAIYGSKLYYKNFWASTAEQQFSPFILNPVRSHIFSPVLHKCLCWSVFHGLLPQ